MRWDFRQIIDAEPYELAAALCSAEEMPARLEASGAQDVTVLERSHTEDPMLVRMRATLCFNVDAPQPCPSAGGSHGCDWTETWLCRADSTSASGAMVIHIERIPALFWGRVRLNRAEPGRTQVWLTLDAEPFSRIVGLEAIDAAGRAVFELLRRQFAQLATSVRPARTLATAG